MFEKEYIDRGIEIKFSPLEKSSYGDRDPLSQVLINLISNALRYTDLSEKIEISVTDNHSFVEISVKDNGIGISSEDLSNVFQWFYRVDRSRA